MASESASSSPKTVIIVYKSNTHTYCKSLKHLGKINTKVKLVIAVSRSVAIFKLLRAKYFTNLVASSWSRRLSPVSS